MVSYQLTQYLKIFHQREIQLFPLNWAASVLRAKKRRRSAVWHIRQSAFNSLVYIFNFVSNAARFEPDKSKVITNRLRRLLSPSLSLSLTHFVVDIVMLCVPFAIELEAILSLSNTLFFPRIQVQSTNWQQNNSIRNSFFFPRFGQNQSKCNIFFTLILVPRTILNSKNGTHLVNDAEINCLFWLCHGK